MRKLLLSTIYILLILAGCGNPKLEESPNLCLYVKHDGLVENAAFVDWRNLLDTNSLLAFNIVIDSNQIGYRLTICEKYTCTRPPEIKKRNVIPVWHEKNKVFLIEDDLFIPGNIQHYKQVVKPTTIQYLIDTMWANPTNEPNFSEKRWTEFTGSKIELPKGLAINYLDFTLLQNDEGYMEIVRTGRQITDRFFLRFRELFENAEINNQMILEDQSSDQVSYYILFRHKNDHDYLFGGCTRPPMYFCD